MGQRFQDNRGKPTFSHDPFDITHDGGIRVVCDINGKITITQHDIDGTPDEFDQINTSAALILRVAKMLTLTRKVKYNDV